MTSGSSSPEMQQGTKIMSIIWRRFHHSFIPSEAITDFWKINMTTFSGCSPITINRCLTLTPIPWAIWKFNYLISLVIWVKRCSSQSEFSSILWVSSYPEIYNFKSSVKEGLEMFCWSILIIIFD